MHRASRLVALVLAVALLLSGLTIGAVSAAAQEAGAAVPVANEEGEAVGSITVNEVVDPFSEFDPSYPPEAGARYVVLNLAFDADAGARFDIDPYAIVLQDDQGFLWNRASINLPDDALVPELSSQTLAPGSRVTGLVGFVVPEGSNPARVFYQPESSRIVPLAELQGGVAPGLGEAVTIPDSEGGSGAVTVSEVVDPFEDVDPGQVPPDGTRFVLATLVYENPGTGRFFIEPYGLLLRDANGNLWSATSVSRPDESAIVPHLGNAQLAPGDRLSGAVVFAVPADVDLAGLYLSPVSGQLVQLAALGEGADGGLTSAAATPEAAASEEGDEASDEGADETTAAPADETSALASGDCAELERWVGEAQARIQQAGAMSVEDATLSDLASAAEHVAAYRQLAADQLADQAPPEADAAGKALVATLNAYGDAMEQILGAAEPGKDTVVELTSGMNTFNEAGTRLQQIEEELGRIAAAC